MSPTRQEIEAVIEASIRKALQRKVDEIGLDTSLLGDLGVNSLDLVEIVYGVEEAFEIEIMPDELFPQRLLRDPDYVRGGSITEAGIAKLREQFSYTTLPAIEPGTPVAHVANKLLTVRALADYVQFVIEQDNG
jgi:acyl carrier protein